MDKERYRAAIQKKVCEHCQDSDEKGRCTLPVERECGVLAYLDQIIDVVHSIRSDNLEDYTRALRERVCAHCRNQDPNGICQFRLSVDCALDRFFELVVEAVEEVDAAA